MPDDPAAACPPNAEKNTSEAPGPRPAPLQGADKADLGCMIMLGAVFAGIFLFIPAIWFGGPFVIVVIGVLLLALATPFLNPLERRASKAKWWGRVLTFLLLAGMVLAACVWVSRYTNQMVDDDEFSLSRTISLPGKWLAALCSVRD